MSIKIIFMGTPDFSVPALQALHEHDGFEVVGVYSQPPRAAGRGKSLRKSPIHTYAEDNNIPVFTPLNFKKDEAVQEFQALGADIAVVAAYGLILPQVILDAPKFGCINIHASLLPRWRGAAPIQRAIEAGDDKTGIGIMQMEAGLDTGPVMMEREIEIVDNMNAGELHDALSNLSAQMIVPAVEDIINGRAQFIAQNTDGITYAHKLQKNEGALDLSLSAKEIHNKILSFTPWPGCFLTLSNGQRLKIIKTSLPDFEDDKEAGTILSKDLVVACGSGVLKFEVVQPQSKSKMDGRSYLNGFGYTIGDNLIK